MQRTVIYYPAEHLKRDANGCLVRKEPKELSRRDAHRKISFNKSPRKRVNYEP